MKVRASLSAVGGIAFTSSILFVVVLALAAATAWPYEARLLPWIIGVPTAVLCVAVIGLDIWRMVRGDPPKTGVRIMDIQADDGVPRAVVARRAAVMFLWMFGLFAAVWLVGFLVTIPAFIFLYLLIQGREPLRVCIIASLAMMAFTVIVFHYLLHVSWLPGLFPAPQEIVIAWLNSLR